MLEQRTQSQANEKLNSCRVRSGSTRRITLKLLFLVQFETGGGVAFGVVKLAGHGVSFDGAGDAS